MGNVEFYLMPDSIILHFTIGMIEDGEFSECSGLQFKNHIETKKYVFNRELVADPYYVKRSLGNIPCSFCACFKFICDRMVKLYDPLTYLCDYRKNMYFLDYVGSGDFSHTVQSSYLIKLTAQEVIKSVEEKTSEKDNYRNLLLDEIKLLLTYGTLF